MNVIKKPLNDALSQLFIENDIQHAKIGNQIVLKPNKETGNSTIPTQISQQTPIEIDPFASSIDNSIKELAEIKYQQEQEKQLAEENLAKEKRQEILSDVIGGIGMEQNPDLSAKAIEPIDLHPIPITYTNISPTQPSLLEEFPLIETCDPTAIKHDSYRLAQASILPMLGTNTDNPDLTNLLSFNLFWGVNGGLEGMELGFFGNSIKRDMSGLQIAGLFNTIGNQTNGMQVAGLFNLSAGNLNGLQVSGLWNTAKHTNGMQVAGFGNIATEQSNGGQYAGFMNVAKDINGQQVAGGLNVAREVNGMQIGLINRAKNVRGIQIGIINIVDSIQGVPIDLFNIVRKNGYNKIEISAAETMHANLSFKFGARAMYSILELSGNRNLKTWSAGYGLGAFCPMGKVAGVNFELVTAQVNEDIRWQRELNLLNQLRMTFDFRFTKHFSFFVGPTFNVMVSRIYNPDTRQYGSDIPLYNLYNETFNGTNIKMWIGAKAGFRFL